MNVPFLQHHPPLISHYEHGHITLPQTIESLKVCQALNRLSFGRKLANSKYQTPNSSSGVKRIFPQMGNIMLRILTPKLLTLTKLCASTGTLHLLARRGVLEWNSFSDELVRRFTDSWQLILAFKQTKILISTRINSNLHTEVHSQSW